MARRSIWKRRHHEGLPTAADGGSGRHPVLRGAVHGIRSRRQRRPRPCARVARGSSKFHGRAPRSHCVALPGCSRGAVFLWFATALRARIRHQEGEDDTISSIAWGAGLVTVSLMLVGNSGSLAADFRAVQGSGAADLAQLWALGLAPGILSTITSATLLAATALASFRSGILPRTLGYSAAVIAVGLLVGSVEHRGVCFLSPLWESRTCSFNFGCWSLP